MVEAAAAAAGGGVVVVVVGFWLLVLIVMVLMVIVSTSFSFKGQIFQPLDTIPSIQEIRQACVSTKHFRSLK